MLVFGLAACVQRFLQILWIFSFFFFYMNIREGWGLAFLHIQSKGKYKCRSMKGLVTKIKIRKEITVYIYIINPHGYNSPIFFQYLSLFSFCNRSLNLLMILWTVDDEIPKFLANVRWEMLFLNCKTICSRSCSQSGEPRPILALEQLSLLGMILLY